MTDRELMQQALDALELEDMACHYEKDSTPEHIAKAITALRERLAQPEQEPVAWVLPKMHPVMELRAQRGFRVR